MSAPFTRLGQTKGQAPESELTQMSPLQQRKCSIPLPWHKNYIGGRGTGKTRAMEFDTLTHVEVFGPDARCFFGRPTFAALEDVATSLCRLISHVYGDVSYNATSGIIRVPNGATVEVAQLGHDEKSYNRLQGRPYTQICIDEVTQYPSPKYINLLGSNLRGPKWVDKRIIKSGNPGGPGHLWFKNEAVLTGVPHWEPYEIDGRTFVSCPSTYLDNPFIDQEAYKRELEAACQGDPELLKGWLDGSWNIAKGAFFGSVLSEKRSAFSMTPEELEAATTYADDIPNIFRCRMPPLDTKLYLGHDFGVSAPSVTYVCARSPGFGMNGQYFPRDSLLLLDELSTNVPDDYTTGLGYTVPHLAEEIVDLSKRWGMKRAEGVADDAVFSKGGHVIGSIAEEFRRHSVYFQPARKAQRIPGWQKLRILMENAGKPDVAGFYASRACVGFWATAPVIGRDPRRPDDLDSRGPDHWCDCARYSLARGTRPSFRVMPIHDFLGGRR